jgi:hypothetical protein
MAEVQGHYWSSVQVKRFSAQDHVFTGTKFLVSGCWYTAGTRYGLEWHRLDSVSTTQVWRPWPQIISLLTLDQSTGPVIPVKGHWYQWHWLQVWGNSCQFQRRLSLTQIACSTSPALARWQSAARRFVTTKGHWSSIHGHMTHAQYHCSQIRGKWPMVQHHDCKVTNLKPKVTVLALKTAIQRPSFVLGASIQGERARTVRHAVTDTFRRCNARSLWQDEAQQRYALCLCFGLQSLSHRDRALLHCRGEPNRTRLKLTGH